MKLLLTARPKLTRRRSARLVLTLFVSLTLAVLATFALRGVSADTLGNFGITEQSRVGRLLGQFAPQTFPSTRETAHGETALKLLKERGQYEALQQALETARYRAHAAPQRAGEFLALNPAQALHSRFTPQGVEVRRHSDEESPRLAMTLRGLGYGDRQLAVSPGTVTAQDQRIEIQRTIGTEEQSAIRNPQSAITEWYINRPTGLEQGFTLAAPPSGAGERRAGERLRLTLELSGEWQARLSADGQVVDFSEAAGGGTLRYDHLVVRDARGQTLPARMSLDRRELRLEVEDTGAVWPVTIDPTLAQQAYLKASNTGENDRFGVSVAISGDTVVVGASDEDSSTTGVNSTPNEAASDSGAAYVFVRNAGVWTQQAYLKPSNTGENDGFGASVAVAGDTVVVGASAENSTSTGVNSSPNDSGFVAGAAYVFLRNAGVWTQQAYLKASNSGNFDQFGASVAVAGDTAVVGAVFEDSDTTGVNNTPNEGATESGAAYVFVRNAGVWTQQAYLKASNTGAGDIFGSVAVSGDTLVVGAYGERSSTTGVNSTPNDLASGAGAAYVFVRNAGVWIQQAYLKASNTGMNHLFGLSVAVAGDTVVAGAIGESGSAGAAYVYVRSAGVWTQQAYLKASNAGGSDKFGQSVAVAGDTAVVGAFQEDSSTTGVNSTPNEGAGNSGAAYVFGRSGTTWTQESYLKASNTGGADNFGISAAISGDTVVIGAYGEASNATGVNGNQNDNSAPGAGAAYVFAVPDAPTFTPAAAIWRQQGSPAGTAVNVGTVTDAQTAAGSLLVTQIAGGTATGITVTGITNTAGTITAVVTASCSAASGTVRFQVSDGSFTGTGDLQVNLHPNIPPFFGYDTPQGVQAGGLLTVIPSVGPGDNGSLTSIVLQSQGGYTGVISVNDSLGVVYLSNAGPVGSHTIVVRATDNCGVTTDAAFTLHVLNSAPTITAAAALTRQRGSAGLVSTIATVSDVETPVGSLVVTVTTVPAGITVTSMTGTAGTITANVAADCTATIGINIVVLTVMDGNGGAATASLWVNVTDNTAPAVTYADASVNVGTATGNSPTTATDNGSITGYSIVSVVPALTVAPTVNASGSVSITNAGPAGNHVFTVQATDNCGATTNATFTLMVNCQTIMVNPETLGSATTSATFSQTFMQADGIGAITWSLIGAAPPGLSFNAMTATLSGSPTASGSFSFTIRATDQNNCFGERQYTLGVDCASVVVSPTDAGLPGGTAGTPYSQNFMAAGGASPYGFTVSAGTLPNGLTLAPSGLFSGTATGFGLFNFTVKATDANGCFGERAYTLRICGVISLTASLPGGTTGIGYNQTITASGSASPYSLAVTDGNLPPGLNLSTAGALTGTPTNNGSFNFTVTATDDLGCTGTQTYAVNIGCQTVTINQTTLPNGFAGSAYSQTLTAAGGTAPYSFTVSAGTLPGGVTLASGGALSGTPTTQATFTFTIRATDANGCFGERGFTVLVSGNGLQFFPLPQPVRLLETRAGFSGCVNPGTPVNAYGTLTLPAQGGCSGIPANAAAVTGNITVVPQGGGYLTLFPSSASQPTVANSNFAAGEITNNVFTVGLGVGDGAFKIFSSATTEVIVDVTGYYAPPGTAGLYFHPLATPVRLLETRTGFNGCIATGAPLNGTGNPDADPGLDFPMQGRAPVASPCNSIPAAAQVLVGNATSVLPSGGGYLTIYPSGGTRPTVASSNYAGSDVINGPFAVKLGADGKFKVYTFATTDLVIDILGYYSEDAVDANGPGLLFNPLPSPVRLLETRPDFPGFPLSGCTRTNTQISGNLAVATHTQQAAGFCGLPASAQAVVGNVSVVNSEGAGFLTLFPGNLASAPLVATSNYPALAAFGYNRHYVVALSPVDGTFKVLTQFTTDLVLDASGYFAP